MIPPPSGERILGIETSSPLAGVALVEGEKVLAEAAFDTRSARSEVLLQEGKRLLDRLAWSPADLSCVAYSAGPGSFTGLRVGMASALGLASGADLPVVAIPTLEVLAYPWRNLGETLVCVSGHRRRQLYFAAYRWEGGRWAVLAPPSGISEHDLSAALAVLPGSRLLFVGDALDSLASAVGAPGWDRVCPLSKEPPRASSVARLALDRGRERWAGKELEGRSPIYLRDADARKPGQPHSTSRRQA
jgi:tRNA threonylcarbamoyladenosine biosynthesis protein TsaB